jgi:uncharacterized protein (DUF934 family)
MVLVKNRVVVVDPWVRVADDEPLPDGRPAIVPLERWKRDRETLIGRNTAVGVRLKSDQSPSLIADDLPRLGVVALEFPKFTDGRAYSYGRLLRERYGYAGEMRAVGNVLRDQLAFMERAGFDAFELPDKADPAAWLQSLDEISVAYQPFGRRKASVAEMRGAPVLRVQGGERDSVVVAMWAY